jgi:hypothetical protein
MKKTLIFFNKKLTAYLFQTFLAEYSVMSIFSFFGTNLSQLYPDLLVIFESGSRFFTTISSGL